MGLCMFGADNCGACVCHYLAPGVVQQVGWRWESAYPTTHLVGIFDLVVLKMDLGRASAKSKKTVFSWGFHSSKRIPCGCALLALTT